MNRKKLHGLLWLVLIIATASGAALGLPYFARQVPWSVEERLSHHFGTPPGLQICDGRGHPEAVAHFQALIRRLYPIEPTDAKFPLKIQVISGQTMNAFATLGGHVYVYEGLLRQAATPEELAGVLAHEVEHVAHRHIIQGAITEVLTLGMLQIFSGSTSEADLSLARTFLNMRFTQSQEHEADVAALARLKTARISASGFEQFFEHLEKLSSIPSILSDHPASADRARLARSSSGYAAEPIMNGSAWAELKRICD
ncbi:MAG: M48 family metallopeptidase [Bdellovibrionota bacterium]